MRKVDLKRLFGGASYRKQVEAEGRKWGSHLEVEASGSLNAWLDHPRVLAHYQERAAIEGLTWEAWISRHLGRPAARSLDLGCGAGERSLGLWRAGGSRELHGIDLSAERVAEGERKRREIGAPGELRVADMNDLDLAPGSYDIIFSCHSFHHFLALETILEQVERALTADGLFILEEFVGPTQFQWTDRQLAATNALLALLPEELRRFRWGALKHAEGRPTVAEVVAASPFESIRSAEILPLFEERFEVLHLRKLGGTIQQLLHNGIVHNFWPETEESGRALRGIFEAEDALVDSGLLPSDFVLLVGRRKRTGRG
jgi:SAM-dependent methyltransferase